MSTQTSLRSAFWPLWKHMIDKYGLVLMDSELSEIVSVAERAGWRPAETMPEDGSRVMVLNERGRINICNKPKGYALGQWSPRHGGRGWCGYADVFPGKITHWHPLPALPNVSGEPRSANAPDLQ